MFGANWTVQSAEEIDYSTENQRVAFDSGTYIHVKENPNDNTGGKENS